MEFALADAACIARFDRGEIIPDRLTEFAREQKWLSAYITGIGAVKDVTLACFDLEQKKYLEFQVDGVVELLALNGNLSILNDKPFWHLHAIVGDRQGNVRGGHVVHLEVAITLECWIRTSS